MLSQLIQRQIPIGNKAAFILKDGRNVSGVLVEIGREHVTLENQGRTSTILVEMIGGWEALEEETLEFEGRSEQVSAVLETKSAPETETTQTRSEYTDPIILQKLIEIEARFNARIQVARLDLETPDFVFPMREIPSRHQDDVRNIWDRITNRYRYAEKINELSDKFGRIQPLAYDLASLVNRFPTSPTLKRHLAYFYHLLGRKKEAQTLYREAASISPNSSDWRNLATLALRINEYELACYALEQVFYQIPITGNSDAWYVYVKLLQDIGNYPALVRLCETSTRNLSEEELVILFETSIYLIKTTGKNEAARDLLYRQLREEDLLPLTLEALSQIESKSNESYRAIVDEFAKVEEDKKNKERSQAKVPEHPQGYILSYTKHRNFGFIKDPMSNEYFFHRSAIIDPSLYDELDRVDGEQIPVIFEIAQGPKGPLALKVTRFRTIDELFELANECAKDGDYAKAIGYIRQVLNNNAAYPNAQNLYEKWREYARVTGVPRGSNPYARAKRVQLVEKDLDRAAQLFRQAIKEGDSVESAVKDLASLLVQQGHTEQAIKFLQQNRKKVQDQQSVDNMLIGFYQNANQYDQVIALLHKKLDQISGQEKRIQVLWQIASCYLRQENYAQAKREFEKVLKLHPDNLAAQRNIAICHFKQGQFEEAEKILNSILDTLPDAKAAELLEAITRAKTTGESAQVDEIIIDTSLSDFSGEISAFTQFFLNRCEFQGVPPDRIQSGKFNTFDIKKLEELAGQLGTRRPRERAGYYLSAAKITSILEDESSNQFYRYLCRSFASSGDATIAESKHLDAARELYCEALSVYDRDRGKRDEQDAVNALVRFLFSTLGQKQVPLTPNIPSIDETVEQVISCHPHQNQIFDAITYLVYRSRYAANRILKRLYAGSSLQAMALEYVKGKGVSVPAKIERLDDFVRLWNEIRRAKLDEWRSITSEFRFLAQVELTTASLGTSIERLKTVNHHLFFDLDQERARQLQAILETALDLVRQDSFGEQERLCRQVESRCDDLLREIETNPTKLSVEEIFLVVSVIQNKVKNYLNELYTSSIPQLELRLPKESYIPDNNQQIEMQIVVANRVGRSPAESLELIIQEDESLFILNAPEITLAESLPGGEQRILRLPIRVTGQAIESQTFSLPMYAQYRTRSGEIEQTTVHNFSIRLYPEESFEPIESPYAAYAESGIVADPTMFYGRDELINNITSTIQESRSQSKSIIVFGQKRAGKSSILYHLKRKLEASGDLLILDVGNIGSILDEQSSAPLLYQMLWSILRKLEYAIEDTLEDKGFAPLREVNFPSDKEFYRHPSPLVLFKDVFDRYKRSASRTDGWRDLRVVLLIDEFAYIYELIVSGRVPELFMKNWKALLQENYFSVILAGQDVMPKFKHRFPNEFGTTQDERVSYLKRADAERLIDEPIRIGGRQGESRYRERAIERIVDLTAGSPFYIQIICDRLVKYMNERRAALVTEADVEQVKNDLIRGVNALDLTKFDNLVNSGDKSSDAISDDDALKVLKTIAMNSQTGPCNRNSIICETETPTDVILDDLVNRDVVERERERYYQIRVGLFKEWLIAHQ
jgi:tetratricopeptide (TPR) repeat protein